MQPRPLVELQPSQLSWQVAALYGVSQTAKGSVHICGDETPCSAKSTSPSSSSSSLPRAASRDLYRRHMQQPHAPWATSADTPRQSSPRVVCGRRQSWASPRASGSLTRLCTSGVATPTVCATPRSAAAEPAAAQAAATEPAAAKPVAAETKSASTVHTSPAAGGYMVTPRRLSHTKLKLNNSEQGAGRSRTLTRTHRETSLGSVASCFSSRSPSKGSLEGSRSRRSSVRAESPIQTDFPSKLNMATVTGSKALRQRRLQEKRGSYGLFRDLPNYSPCGNHLECTGGEGHSPNKGKTPGLHKSRPACIWPDRSLYLREMTSRDPLQVRVTAAPDEAGGPAPACKPQLASQRKVVEAGSMPSLWMPTCWDKSPSQGDAATERGAEAVIDSKAEAGNTVNAIREPEILMAASRKLENWLALGKPRSAQDLAKILAMPPGSAQMIATAAGRPTRSPYEGLGPKEERSPLIHTSASCANLAVERRRDTHCPIRAASGTLLALRRDEAKSALHPVVANTRKLGVSRASSICKSPRRA